MNKKSKKNNLPYCTSCHRKAMCHHLKATLKWGRNLPTTKRRQTAMTEAFKQNYGRVDKVIDKAIDKAQKEWCRICRHRNCHHKRGKAFDHLMALPGIDKDREEATQAKTYFAPITVRIPWKPIELRNIPLLDGR